MKLPPCECCFKQGNLFLQIQIQVLIQSLKLSSIYSVNNRGKVTKILSTKLTIMKPLSTIINLKLQVLTYNKAAIFKERT